MTASGPASESQITEVSSVRADVGSVMVMTLVVRARAFGALGDGMDRGLPHSVFGGSMPPRVNGPRLGKRAG